MKQFLAATVVLFSISVAQQTPKPQLGTNLSSVNYYSPQPPFANIFKTAKAWHSGSSSAWDDGRIVALDANGNVTKLENGQIARTLMLRDIGGNYPSGTYTLSYTGDGEIRLGFAVRNQIRQNNQIRFEVAKSDDGILLEITRTNPSNPIRDIRLTLPGGICQGVPEKRVQSSAQCGNAAFLEFAKHPELIFNPDFLERTKPYTALRMMDWQETNNSEQTNKRPKPTDATWGIHGVPLEVMVELANTLNQDLWLNVPHQATDGLILEMAQIVQRQLKPNLRVYVEHSNEVWNGQFSQHAYARQKGRNANLSSNDFEAALLYHAERTRAIGTIWRNELGKRLTVVLAGQAANVWTLERPLEYLRQKYGNAGIDALAIAPYMTIVPDPQEAPAFEKMSVDQLLNKLEQETLPESIGWMRGQAELAQKYNLQLLAYEGGQHLVGVRGAENRETLNTLFFAVNRHPKIGQLYLEYLNAWRKTSSGVFMHFTDIGVFSKFGSWGALENLYQPRSSAPKFDALMRFLEQR